MRQSPLTHLLIPKGYVEGYEARTCPGRALIRYGLILIPGNAYF